MGEIAPLLAAQAMGTAANVGNTLSQNAALRGQTAFSSRMAEVNARWAEMQAQDVIRRGQAEAVRIHSATRQLIGAQRARGGASGIDVNSGSLSELQGEAALLGHQDMLTAENNAYRMAIGYRAERAAILGRSRLNEMAARNQMRNSIISMGMQVGQDALKSYWLYDRYAGLGSNSPSAPVDDDFSYTPPSMMEAPSPYDVPSPGGRSEFA